MRRVALIIALGAVLGLFTTACNVDSGNKGTEQAKQGVNQRLATFDRASKQVPSPNVSNFPRRQTLADAVERQTLPHHPWYVYVLGLNGNIVNYFVARSVPVNDCDYLSSTQDVHHDTDGGNYILGAPSLEGIFQSASGCDTLTFFDLTTNAEIQVSRGQTFVTDRPLRVDAAPIRVRTH